MKPIIIAVLSLLILTPKALFAGAANAELECVSVGKKGDRMTLKGDIPGDFAEFSLEFKVGEKSVEMNDRSRDDTLAVVNNWKRKVFTVYVDSKNGYRNLVMYAVPASVRTRKRKNETTVKFQAILEQAPIPEYEGPLMYKAFVHDVKMKCTWRYSI